ncbi:baculoviral Iap repeat-containing protein 3 [Colletotrichum musicola]|uniref:Baculoviral Iap repeat-containing protein 3 n=1 Tax=Colletotrichum musicola TaxID=2175873 RepID=A0A8H6MHD5_9PEZI|nr:baculoviral Iap repeat-containing protein 3 [Colletotrichum musicola]
MSDYSQRLATFYADGPDGQPNTWPIAHIRPEDMAGAGFRFAAEGFNNSDAVVCDECRLHAWSWERKDNPFQQHRDGARQCSYVGTETFERHHGEFLANAASREVVDAPMTPPATPPKRTYKSRRRIKLSPIMTVCSTSPSNDQVFSTTRQEESRAEPVEVSISAGGTTVIIQVTADVGMKGRLARLLGLDLN